MSTPAPPKPNPAPQPSDDPEVVPIPPDEEFWEKYNRRFEFPFSTVGAVLLHVAVACLLVVLWAKMRDSAPDKEAVPVVISPVDGIGEGSPGAELGIDPISKNDEEIKAPITAEELAQLPAGDCERVRDAIRALGREPRPPGCLGLTGRDGWRIRVGRYRVIDEIDDAEQAVLVLRVGDRRNVYR